MTVSARWAQKPYERIIKFDSDLGFDSFTLDFTWLRMLTTPDVLYVHLLALIYRRRQTRCIFLLSISDTLSNFQCTYFCGKSCLS